jgi:flagellar biosynthesis/type III secretory pathway protein FliH
MKHRGTVVDTGTKRGGLVCFTLKKILEDTPNKEVTTSPVEEETTPVVNSNNEVNQILLSRLAEIKKMLEQHFKAIIEAMPIIEASDTQMRASFNELSANITKHVIKTTEIHDHNSNVHQELSNFLTKFVENTNENFREIEHYFQTIKESFNGSSSNEAYRSGYKDGFKDGREDFRGEFKPAQLTNKPE